MPRLGTVVVIKRDGRDGSKFPVITDSCTFGRSTDCDVRINLGTVSQQHCRLIVNRRGVTSISNVSKENQTLLNGKSIKSQIAVRHNDIITIADRQFRWESAQTTDVKSNSRSPCSGLSSPNAQLSISHTRRNSYYKSPTPVGIVTPTRRDSSNVEIIDLTEAAAAAAAVKRDLRTSKRSLSFQFKSGNNNVSVENVTDESSSSSLGKSKDGKIKMEELKGYSKVRIRSPLRKSVKMRKLNEESSVKIVAPSSPDNKKAAALRTIHGNRIVKSKSRNSKLAISMNLWNRKKQSVDRAEIVKQAVLRVPKVIHFVLFRISGGYNQN
ncbi:hypothetical protein CHUAL_006029 [Chamberlinius hualienensis]